MNGTMKKPKFWDGFDMPESYYRDIMEPSQYKLTESVNLIELTRYARSANKKLIDLTREEMEMFSTESMEEVHQKLISLI